MLQGLEQYSNPIPSDLGLSAALCIDLSISRAPQGTPGSACILFILKWDFEQDNLGHDDAMLLKESEDVARVI